MALRIDTNEIQNLNGKDIFLDANIWIYLFCPISNSREEIIRKYSRAFNHLIQSDNKMYVDIAVLSEFINRFQRIAYANYMENNANNKRDQDFQFKRDYKKTEDFKEILRLISSTVENKILKWSSVVNLQYEKKDIEELIGNLEEKSIDFNDLHIEKLCQAKRLFLLTDDGDFAGSSIDIISGNPKLLRHF
ncbi:MAG: PIN domain-containing protein [Candidatus Aminicenantes bacterium]|nr:PIN domain-containing protein [Candidatus Aminicenantes bacterium]